MSRAATEINLASSEQAHAFDQLGRHVAGLDGRLEKLERAAVQDDLKEAVRGLHKGLSHLADQFGQATARSGGQTSSLARNLEQLALRLVQARADAEAAAQALEAHLGQVEETQAFANVTIEQILERIEAQTETHDQDMADLRRRGGAQQEALAGMESRLAALEEPDLALEQRLQAIEQVLNAIREELAEPDPHAGVTDALRQVSLRLDMAEQNHSDMLAELREGLARIPEPIVPDPVAPEPVLEEEPVVLFEPMPVLESVSSLEPGAMDLMTELEPSDESAPEKITGQPLSVSDIMPDNFAQHAFAAHFDMPQDFADALARPSPANDGPANNGPASDGPTNDAPANDVPANEQDFLDSARRSAREAAEADARGLLG